MNALEAAIGLATVAHAGQVDKAGAPYILHPLRVMLALQPYGEDAMVAGVLHDVLEDTATTEAQLRELFSAAAVDAIVAVTKQPGERHYGEFILRIAEEGGALAIRVKMADLRDNSDDTRLKRPLTTKDVNRLVKYRDAYAILEAGLSHVGE